MLFRSIASFGLSCLLLSPANAQFGVGKKKAATFEERKQMEQNKAAGLDSANLMDQLGDLDPNELKKMYEEAMKDPATQKLMEQYGDTFEQISKMDPEELKQQISENLAKLSSPDVLDLVLESKDEVLDSLLEQGLVTKEQYAEYKENPAAFEASMRESFSEMGKILNDPEALNSALDMMTGMSGMMGNPGQALKSISDAFDSQLGSDEKIEEARLQLLQDPSAIGNPALAMLFDSDDMKKILNDPILFREQVKKGQEMLKDQAVGGGANYGEL